ncbi:hypothetical protein [Pseudomonas ogarae]|uniref:Uncharacterized protein n=1 Tax=Pseudomonas ogarae (strain DSM 112162 / CECT 30235 / F113) TaxID=1114970 RepID=A0ABM6R3V7_PSEO1|nr:hypothetical protein [Pseudomonas ogarae]AEV64315.1 Hypothetical protein PSF113_4319 [Pseudomonas ogarae]AUO48143.1 hypothetical protein C1C98_23130 [Pseudomonas ogarae]
MIKFKIDNRTLTLLSAQVNLSGTFNHTLRSTPRRDVLAFRLKVERNKADSTFTIELGSERHTLTLPNTKKTHLKLADFIEEVVNGPSDLAGESQSQRHAEREYGAFSTEHREQVFRLVCTGGFIDLDMGFELPIRLAVHRTRTRSGITVVMSIGVKSPRTKCFTVYGTDAEMYEQVCESISHLAALATPAAHAA